MKDLIDRFEEKVTPEPFSGCHLWAGARDRDGYGRINVNGINRTAHTVSYELYTGEIPDDLMVLHRCDTPPCVNPNHLFLGSHLDNKHDSMSKKRHAYGTRVHSCSLTAAKVEKIRKEYPGMTLIELGKLYDVDSTTVWKIVTRKSWRHLLN